MRVFEDKRAVVLALKNPDAVRAVIPKATLLQATPNGSLVAVPHSLDVHRVLKNIGIEIPHPIKHYYKWQGRFTPLIHQIETSAFLASYMRCYCLNGMGAMKTISTLWAYDYLRSIGRVKRMLVLAPLSTLEPTWAREVFNHFPELTCTVLHGSKERRTKLLAQPADIYVINHDGIKVMEKELLLRDDINVICLDELAAFRNPRTNRWKACKRVVDTCEWAWGLTGTPTPNSPEDAFGQIKMLTPGTIPRAFGTFQDMVSRPVGPYKRVPREDAQETVHRVMQPAIRYSTRDCVDLPPTIYQSRHIPLSPDQMEAYKRMRDLKIFEMGNNKTIAVNEAIVAMKLIQIACGAVYTGEDNEPSRIESPERIEEVKEIIEQAEGKVIVFCPVIGALDYITEQLQASGLEVGQIDGRVPKHRRDEVFQAFQHAKDMRVIVAQPGAMSHGLTLTAANVIVWYAPCYSNETYEQANARIVRPGQTRTTIIVRIEGTPLERLIYDRLETRGRLQGSLLDMMGA